MAEDRVHKEQQAIKRALNEFGEELWPAFKKSGFENMGQAFTAYLLMQLVSGAAETALDPPLVFKIAKPEGPKEALARMVALPVAPKPVVDAVPVG